MTAQARRWVLVHSPLVGPTTWRGVAAELDRRGQRCGVPTLREPRPGGTYWRAHARSAATAVIAIEGADPVVLVAHSGAGYLLPAVGALLERRVTAYVFVDAGLPRDGASRLDLLAEELPEAAAELRPHLEGGGAYPEWTGEELADELPDPALRAAVLGEVRPRGLDFFTEPISLPERWPDAPVAYLRLSEGYERSARQAEERGWPVVRLDAGHFHLVTQPIEVATHLLALVAEILDVARAPRPRPRGRT